jgi:hypothetical protein
MKLRITFLGKNLSIIEKSFIILYRCILMVRRIDLEWVLQSIAARTPFRKNISKCASIFTAELYALILALDHIAITDHRAACVYSDSLSVLKVLNSLDNKLHPLIFIVRKKVFELKKNGFNVTFCWIPSHVGIVGNEIVDRAAQIRRDDIDRDCIVPWTDLRVIISNHINKRWQQDWSSTPNNKLFQIKPRIQVWSLPSNLSRREEVVLTRLRIGHSILTHGGQACSFLPKGQLSSKHSRYYL